MGREGPALLLGAEADAPASFPPPFLMLLPFSAPRLSLFSCTLVVPPLHCWLSPTGAQAAGRGAHSPPGAHRQQQGDRLILMRKGCQDHGIQPSSNSQAGCALQEGKVTAQGSAGTSSRLEVSPTLLSSQELPHLCYISSYSWELDRVRLCSASQRSRDFIHGRLSSSSCFVYAAKQ